VRVALGIEYDGTAYNGWQRQKTGIGIQSIVEEAIASVADEPIEVVCAGRTDTGVHASAQVVHFDSSAERARRAWLLGVNAGLPDDINTNWAAFVEDEFHARFSAKSRTYRYLILNRPVRSSLQRNRAWWVYEPLDEQAMHEAAQHLLGQHDYSAFRAAGCRAATPNREVKSLQVSRNGDWLAITITANAFLQRMVRNITGLLVAIGKGEQAPGWAKTVLESRDRTQGDVAAPPHGLTLIHVGYPEQFEIPVASIPSFPGFVYDAGL
jgi:tRNA pseudouridine38-40 synthase